MTSHVNLPAGQNVPSDAAPGFTRLSVTLKLSERLLQRIEAEARRRGITLEALLVDVAESALRTQQAPIRRE